MFHRLVFLLVCLGLALQVQAARSFDKPPCPMEAMMQAMLAAGDLDPADLPECCNDLPTYAATGQACKSGTDCSAPVAMMLAATPCAVAARPASTVAQALSPAARVADLATPWRPPAST